MQSLNTKDFMVSLYDLLANNTEYRPRESLDYILENIIEDYCVDVDDDGTAKIIFRTKDDNEYQLEFRQIYTEGEK